MLDDKRAAKQLAEIAAAVRKEYPARVMRMVEDRANDGRNHLVCPSHLMTQETFDALKKRGFRIHKPMWAGTDFGVEW